MQIHLFSSSNKARSFISSISRLFSLVADKDIVNFIQKSGRIKRILMTGGHGQLGTEILPYLNAIYGADNVLVTDIVQKSNPICKNFQFLDVLDKARVESTILLFKPDYIIHYAAKLSAIGELNPKSCLAVNIEGFKNVLDIACEKKIAMFTPSTIGAFGESTPKKNAPNTTIMRPSTIYGCSKVFNELLGGYYRQKYGMDFRSIRYAQTISITEAFGGSGDFSIEIFYGAIRKKEYTCYLNQNTHMSFLYIDDLISGTLQMIEADSSKFSESVYNIQSCSFSVGELVNEIKKHIPDFEVKYEIDFRQKIVDTWPESLDDSLARKEWGFNPKFTIKEMTEVMLKLVREKLN